MSIEMRTAPCELSFEVLPAAKLTAAQRRVIIRLCTAAFEEAFDHLFRDLPASVHVLAYWRGDLVSHAAWVTRWLRPGQGALLRTAYIEAVATAPHYQGRGFGSAVMRKLSQQLAGYELGALAPAVPEFYARLGWECWRGPLAIRTHEGLLFTPEEEVMILWLANTPKLDLQACLTAEWRSGELW